MCDQFFFSVVSCEYWYLSDMLNFTCCVKIEFELRKYFAM